MSLRHEFNDKSPPWATDRCVVCNHKLEESGEHQLCCSHASYDDGLHEDPYCKKCCGPHAPFNPQIHYFPEG
jgi:hypothetical protein